MRTRRLLLAAAGAALSSMTAQLTVGSAAAGVGRAAATLVDAALPTFPRGPGRALSMRNLRRGSLGGTAGEPSHRSSHHRLWGMISMSRHPHDNGEKGVKQRGSLVPPDVRKIVQPPGLPTMCHGRETGAAAGAPVVTGTATTRGKWLRRNRRKCDR